MGTKATDTQKDVAEVERRLEVLRESIQRFTESDPVGEMLQIIRHPKGWTTLAELAYALGLIDSMTEQLNLLQDEAQRLVTASRLVGAGEVARESIASKAA